MSVFVNVSLFVYLSVCLPFRLHISKTTRSNFTKLSAPVTCGSGSVLLWWQCDMLCRLYFWFCEWHHVSDRMDGIRDDAYVLSS